VAVAVTPDGRRAVSASQDQTLRLWELESGQTVHPLQGHTSYVTAVAVTPDGRRAVSASWDYTLRLWDLESGQTIHPLQGHTYGVLAVALASAAVAGGIIIAYAARPEGLLNSATFTFARAITYEIMNLYAVKMAAVFMISTSTLTIRTGSPHAGLRSSALPARYFCCSAGAILTGFYWSSRCGCS
jgi:hypothetical protein